MNRKTLSTCTMAAAIVALFVFCGHAQTSAPWTSSGKWVQQPAPGPQQGPTQGSGMYSAQAQQRMANLAQEGEALGWFAVRGRQYVQSGAQQQMYPPSSGYQQPYAEDGKGRYWPNVSKQQVAPYWPQWPGERYQPGQETDDYSRGYPGEMYRQPERRQTETERIEGRAEAGTQERIRRGRELAEDHFMARKEAAEREAMREEARAQAEERRRRGSEPEEEEY